MRCFYPAELELFLVLEYVIDNTVTLEVRCDIGPIGSRSSRFYRFVAHAPRSRMTIPQLMVENRELEDLKNSITSYLPNANLALIERAYEFSQKAHEGQKRFSGEPYFIHAIETAKNIINLNLDEATIAVGLLHDVAEDTPISLAEVRKEFGDEIAFLLRGITKVGQVKLRGDREEDILENLRQLFLVMAEDLRVVFVKLCDRLHNVQTLKYLPREESPRKRLRFTLRWRKGWESVNSRVNWKIIPSPLPNPPNTPG